MILKSRCAVPTEQTSSAPFDVLGDELSDLVDDRDGIHVALTLRVSPCEKTVAAENDAVTVRRLLHGIAQHYG